MYVNRCCRLAGVAIVLTRRIEVLLHVRMMVRAHISPFRLPALLIRDEKCWLGIFSLVCFVQLLN